VKVDDELMVLPAGAAPVAIAPQPRLRVGLIRMLRPRQWTKNALVLAAPAAAGVLHQADVLAAAALAVLAFALASSSTYVVNDLADIEADRAHPVKRHRPIAAGVVPVPVARVAAVVLAVAALAVGQIVAGIALTGIIAAYLVLTLAYSLRLKHVPIADVAAISSGFVLRAVAGAVAVGVAMSDWFVIVVSAGALFLATGKRFSELHNLAEKTAHTRAALGQYTPNFLRHLLFSAATVAILSYSLWAFDQPTTGGPWLALSIAPFALALFNYALLVEQGRAESPEDIVLGDRVTQFLGAAWAALFATGVYAA
jgi:decaprenyl-phosphate phosphoribosyltransferase